MLPSWRPCFSSYSMSGQAPLGRTMPYGLFFPYFSYTAIIPTAVLKKTHIVSTNDYHSVPPVDCSSARDTPGIPPLLTGTSCSVRCWATLLSLLSASLGRAYTGCRSGAKTSWVGVWRQTFVCRYCFKRYPTSLCSASRGDVLSFSLCRFKECSGWRAVHSQPSRLSCS